jgi:hypothetical protein
MPSPMKETELKEQKVKSLEIKSFLFLLQILDRHVTFLRMHKVLYGSMAEHTKFGVCIFVRKRYIVCNRRV